MNWNRNHFNFSNGCVWLPKFLWLSALLLLAACTVAEPVVETREIASPDGSIRVTFLLEDGAPRYQIERLNSPILGPSKLGFQLKNAPPLHNFKIADVLESAFDETWEQPWGEQREIRNQYTEMSVELVENAAPERRINVVFRVYDDGVGLRYELPEQPNLKDFQISEEETEFAFAGPHQCWWIPAYKDNRYEYLPTKSPISEVEVVHTPLTMETEDGLYLSVHEAALTDYASMTLRNKDGSNTLHADLVPWSDGVKVKASTPMVTPWRTLQIAEKPGDLITSYLILNLNEPNALQDVSWIKPAKYVGIWWGMHLNLWTWGSGSQHGATTARTKQYIDFAAKHGLRGVLVEGWNVGWDGDWIQNSELFKFTQPYPDFDIQELAKYAASKGVKIIGHHETSAGIDNYERQLEDAFKFYRDLGIDTVKTGYVGTRTNKTEWHHGQYMVRHYRKVVQKAAEYGIMLDVHEPIKDTGIRRTYPNMMTREGARGMEYDAWGEDGGNPPDYATIIPFTRLLAGPFDMTPGIFDLDVKESRPNNRSNTTLAKQLALYVVIYSPLHMAADLIENYEGKPAFQFIKDVPVDWETTRVLDAAIGDYALIARRDRNSEDWYLGGVTDEEGREMTASLDFLEAGRDYVAEVYADAEDGDWKSNPYAMDIHRTRVGSGTEMAIKLAPGGGVAVRFRPAGEGDSAIPAYPQVSR